MKQGFEKQEAAPEFEIKFGPWGSAQEIQKAFFERRVIQFIGKKILIYIFRTKDTVVYSTRQGLIGATWLCGAT